MMIAGRISLIVGVLGCAVALGVGVAYGAIAGYAGGRVDMAMMRVVDVLYALPFMFFVILLMAFFGRHFVLIFVAIGAVEWLDMARLARGQTLEPEAAGIRRRGARRWASRPGAILSRHIAPNLAGVVVAVSRAADAAGDPARELSLVSRPRRAGAADEPRRARRRRRAAHQDAPWLLMFPAALLTLMLYALNFLGDGLRDALDPRER